MAGSSSTGNNNGQSDAADGRRRTTHQRSCCQSLHFLSAAVIHRHRDQHGGGMDSGTQRFCRGSRAGAAEGKVPGDVGRGEPHGGAAQRQSSCCSPRHISGGFVEACVLRGLSHDDRCRTSPGADADVDPRARDSSFVAPDSAGRRHACRRQSDSGATAHFRNGCRVDAFPGHGHGIRRRHVLHAQRHRRLDDDGVESGLLSGGLGKSDLSAATTFSAGYRSGHRSACPASAASNSFATRASCIGRFPSWSSRSSRKS